MRNCVIYKITNPAGHCYVGQTFNWNRRYKQYLKLQCKGQKALYASFMKHGFENHTFEILMQNIPEEQLNAWEKIWIWAEGSFGAKGLNLTPGGGFERGQNHPAFGKKHTEATKQQMSRANSGDKNPMFGKSGVLSPNFGKKRSIEIVQRIVLANTGQKRTEEQNQKNSERRKKYFKNPENIKNNRLQKHRKSIYCIELNMYFDSIRDACRILFLDRKSLSCHLRGISKYKTVKGKTFRYATSS